MLSERKGAPTKEVEEETKPGEVKVEVVAEVKVRVKAGVEVKGQQVLLPRQEQGRGSMTTWTMILFLCHENSHVGVTLITGKTFNFIIERDCQLIKNYICFCSC